MLISEVSCDNKRRFAENAAAEDSSGSSTDESHTSGYIANTNPFHHVTDHEVSGLLASHEMIKEQKTQPMDIALWT
jgi:hypothetical protein